MVIVIEDIHAYVIGNCNLNFVIVIGKSITSLNSVCLLLPCSVRKTCTKK